MSIATPPPPPLSWMEGGPSKIVPVALTQSLPVPMSIYFWGESKVSYITQKHRRLLLLGNVLILIDSMSPLLILWAPIKTLFAEF